MSDDEAYVRDRICMHEGVDEHPDAKQLLADQVLRNFNRKESDRERKALIGSMEPATMPLAPDVYLTGVWSFQFEMVRFERVIRKIVKGLYAYHFRRRMPGRYGFETLRIMDQGMYAQHQRWMQANDTSPSYFIGERGAVWFQVAPNRESPLGNNWLIIFYHRFGFYVHAGPEGKDGRVTV